MQTKSEKPQFKNWDEFYVFYLGEHQNPINQKLHYLGTILATLVFLNCFLTFSLRYVLLAPLLGYTCAWFGHYFYEKNKPASFNYPLWSFISDYRMFKDLTLVFIGVKKELGEEFKKN